MNVNTIRPPIKDTVVNPIYNDTEKTTDELVKAAGGVLYLDAEDLAQGATTWNDRLGPTKVYPVETTSPIIQIPDIAVNGPLDLKIKGRSAMNIIANGNFANGTTGWAPTLGTNAVINNIMQNIATGESLASSIRTDGITSCIANNKVFVRVTCRATGLDCLKLEVDVRGATTAGAIQSASIVYNPVQNTWYTMAGIVTIPADAVGKIRITIRQTYVDAATATNKVMEIDGTYSKGVMAIDLTATYGVGNEPDLSACSKIFPHWFEGIKDTFGTVKGKSYKNSVVNGDFRYGAANWYGHYGAITANVSTPSLSITGNGLSYITNVYTETPIDMVEGKKIFVRASITVKSTNATNIKLCYNGTDNSPSTYNVVASSVSNPVMNTKYNLSMVFAVNTANNNTGKLRISAITTYPDTGTATGKMTDVQEVFAVDLAAYGIDSLTTEQCNKLLPYYFEGEYMPGTKIKVMGKNLFDGKFELGAYTWAGGVPYGQTDRMRAVNFIPAKSDTYYICDKSYAIFCYDENKKYLGKGQGAGNNFYTYAIKTQVGTAFVRFTVDPTVGTDLTTKVMFQEGTTSGPYRTYNGSNIVISDPLRSLPNGTYDEISLNATGQWQKIQRVSDTYILQSSDILSMSTTLTNVDIAVLSKANFTGFILKDTFDATPNKGTSIRIEGYVPLFARAIDDVGSIGCCYVNTNNVAVVVAKGTTIEQARTALIGKAIHYQLATPIATILAAPQISENTEILPNGACDEISINANNQLQKAQRIGNAVFNGELGYDVVDTVESYRGRIIDWATANNAVQATIDSGIGYSGDGNYSIRATNVISGITTKQIAIALNNIYIYIEKSKIDIMEGADITAKFKAYLNRYPITLKYQFATPVTTILSMAQLLEPTRSLPNGTKDEVKFSAGQIQKVQKVGEKILQASDLFDVTTTYPSYDYARIKTITDAKQWSSSTDGQTLIYGKQEITNSELTNGHTKDNAFYTNYGELWIAVAKGTTLAAAQTALTGTVVQYELATPIVKSISVPQISTESSGYITVEADVDNITPTINYSCMAKTKVELKNFAGTPASGKVVEWANKLVNGQYKSEISYNPNTWAEWTKVGGATGDESGITVVNDGVTSVNSYLNTNFKQSTKYGILFNIVNHNLTSSFRYGTELIGTYSFISAGTTGNIKNVFTTQASITSNRLGLGIGSGVSGTIKIRDIRAFELPSGSEIEADFTNLTADQLAAKYPMPKGQMTPLLRFEGVDDYCEITNMPCIDVTNAPLAVFATVRIPVASQTGYIFAKNLADQADIQYSLVVDNTNNYVQAGFNGMGKGRSANFERDTFFNIGYIWDGAIVKYYLNQINSGVNSSVSGALTSRPNVYIGRRATGAYYKGDMKTFTIYAGPNTCEANVLRAEREITNSIIGG